MITIPEAADGLKEITKSRLVWLNGLMTSGEFISGAKICLADVLLFCFLKFGQSVGQPYDTGLTQIHAWFERVAARDSTNA
jgi:glutathione S-transferase